MNTLCKRGMLKYLTYVEHNGVFEKLLSRGYVSNAMHEFQITELSLHLMVDEVERLDLDEEILPDAVIWTTGKDGNKNQFYLEMDRGTETRKSQIKDRMDAYLEVKDPVLWVFPNESRMKRVLGFAPNDNHWGAVYEKAIKDPHAPNLWKNNLVATETLQKTYTMT